MRRSAWTFISAISKLCLDTSFREFCADISLSENDANSVISELLANRLVLENEKAIGAPALPIKPIANLLKGTSSALALGMFGNGSRVEASNAGSISSTALKMRLGEYSETHLPPSAICAWIWDSEASSSLPAGGEGKSTNKGKDIPRPTAPIKADSTGKSEGKKYKLQPIISQIEKLSSGGVEGSVLVYQVFLKVPTELLREEGIESLKLVDANTEFSSVKLCQAIVRATTQITGYNLKIVGYNR